jgi:hypothetical protein
VCAGPDPTNHTHPPTHPTAHPPAHPFPSRTRVCLRTNAGEYAVLVRTVESTIKMADGATKVVTTTNKVAGKLIKAVAALQKGAPTCVVSVYASAHACTPHSVRWDKYIERVRTPGPCARMHTCIDSHRCKRKHARARTYTCDRPRVSPACDSGPRAVGVATKAPAVPQSHAPAAPNRFVIHSPAACMRRYRTLRPVSKPLGVPRRIRYSNGWSNISENAQSHCQDSRQGRQGTMPTLRYRSDPTQRTGASALSFR